LVTTYVRGKADEAELAAFWLWVDAHADELAAAQPRFVLDSDEDVRTFTTWRNGRELSRAWMMRDRGRYPELGEVFERLLRMSLRGAEKVTAEREDESFDRWYLPRAVTAPPNVLRISSSAPFAG
jgi:hypothetical protein